MRVIVHAKLPGQCGPCDRVKEFLKTIHVPFQVIEHAEQCDRDAIYDSFGLQGSKRTMPQVVIVRDSGARERVGGYEETLRSPVWAERDRRRQSNSAVRG